MWEDEVLKNIERHCVLEDISDIESIYQFLFKKFNLHCKYGGFEGLEVSLNELADQKHKYLKYKKRAEELGANVFLYPEELNYLEVQN